MIKHLLCTLITSMVCQAQAEILLGYRSYFQYNDKNSHSVFQTPKDYAVFPKNELLQEVRLNVQQGGFNMLLNGVHGTRKNKPNEKEFIINEAYYDFSVTNWYLSIGKRILGWGVGQAFRPLDVIQREDRRRLIPNDLEGLPLLSVESFNEASSHTLTYANRTNFDNLKVTEQRHELAYKYYRLQGERDTQAIVHWSEEEHLSFGSGVAAVINNATEVHGSFLWRDNCLQNTNSLIESEDTLAFSNPFVTKNSGSCMKALMGFSWSDPESGITLLFEAWHDGEAHSHRDWKQQLALAENQRTLLPLATVPEHAVFLNLKADQQFYAQPILLKNNLMARLSWSGEKFFPAFDILLTPKDRGVIITPSFTYNLNENANLLGALRYFSGAGKSGYQQIADDIIIFVGIEMNFML